MPGGKEMNNIDLHKRLQPFYKEKMGALIKWDKFYVKSNSIEAIFLFEQDNQFFCLEKDTLGTTIFGTKNTRLRDDAILRIPLPIDPVNPERGLLGMLLSHGVHRIEVSSGGLVNIWRAGSFVVNELDLETALLKALIEQEGYE